MDELEAEEEADNERRRQRREDGGGAELGALNVQQLKAMAVQSGVVYDNVKAATGEEESEGGGGGGSGSGGGGVIEDDAAAEDDDAREAAAAAARMSVRRSKLDKKHASARHKAEGKAARRDQMEHLVDKVVWGLGAVTAAVDSRPTVSAEELESCLGPCGYEYDRDSPPDPWSVAGCERMLGPFYLIEMVAQAAVNAMPNQLAQSSAARKIVDQISSCMLPYCKLQMLSSEDKEEDEEREEEDEDADEREGEGNEEGDDEHHVRVRTAEHVEGAEVEMSVRAKAAAADIADAQLASVTSVMEGLARELRATLTNSAIARRADAHLDAMVSMPETVGMSDEQKQALARVWAMGVDGAEDETDGAFQSIKRSTIQRYSETMERMMRRAKARVEDAWGHWLAVQARILAVAAAITILPAALAMPSTLLIRRIELNADFEGDGGGLGFWIVPIVFACVHVLTLVAESHLHSTRSVPRSRLAIEVAYGMRRACLALFIVEVALVAGTAATAAAW
jgi:hypothetical protein